MARYNVKEQVQEIATLKNISTGDVLDILGVWHAGDEVGSRADQSRVLRTLADLKEVQNQKTIRDERANGYRWINHPTGWVVDGDFTNKKAGDTITVTKASGERQEKKIVRFTGDGKAKVL